MALNLKTQTVMKTWLKFLIGIMILLLILQLPYFRPEVNHSTADPLDDIGMKYDMPMYVMMSLNDACYDCHSNYTSYVKIDEGSDGADSLWYRTVQPISWWLNKHIKDGKEALNFSEFAQLSSKDAAHKFKEIQEVMEEKTMPLRPYVWLHDEGRLTDEERQEIIDWAKEMEDQLMNPSTEKAEEESEDFDIDEFMKQLDEEEGGYEE